MALKLNIKTFDGDGDDRYVNPGPWNQSCRDFEGGASEFNSALEGNEQVIAAMREFLGSPMMTEVLRPMVDKLTNCTTDAKGYFDSVNGWSGAMMEGFNSLNKTSEAESTHTTVNEQIMKNVEEHFNGQSIGLRSSSDVPAFVSRVEEVISRVTQSLGKATAAAESANNNIPSIIYNPFHSSVQSSHDGIRNGIEQMNRLVTDSAQQFEQALTSWASDAASAAAGSSN